MIYLEDFDVKFINVVRRESRIGVDIYYIGYHVEKSEYKINSMNSLYLVVRHLLGRIEKIDGTSDRYLVVDDINKKVLDVFDGLWKFIGDRINELMKNNDKITFGVPGNVVKGYNKLRFSSNADLPVGKLIEFHALTVVISCVIEEDGKYYHEV